MLNIVIILSTIGSYSSSRSSSPNSFSVNKDSNSNKNDESDQSYHSYDHIVIQKYSNDDVLSDVQSDRGVLWATKDG